MHPDSIQEQFYGRVHTPVINKYLTLLAQKQADHPILATLTAQMEHLIQQNTHLIAELKDVRRQNIVNVEKHQAYIKQIEHLKKQHLVWIDHDNQLMWSRVCLGQNIDEYGNLSKASKYGWYEAKVTSEALEPIGHHFWRLPTSAELKKLYALKAHFSKIQIYCPEDKILDFWSDTGFALDFTSRHDYLKRGVKIINAMFV